SPTENRSSPARTWVSLWAEGSMKKRRAGPRHTTGRPPTGQSRPGRSPTAGTGPSGERSAVHFRRLDLLAPHFVGHYSFGAPRKRSTTSIGSCESTSQGGLDRLSRPTRQADHRRVATASHPGPRTDNR